MNYFIGVLFSIINLGTYLYYFRKKNTSPLFDDVDAKEDKLYAGNTSA